MLHTRTDEVSAQEPGIQHNHVRAIRIIATLQSLKLKIFHKGQHENTFAICLLLNAAVQR